MTLIAFKSDNNYIFAIVVRKLGRIHGNPVADGSAGAEMRKPLEIQKYFEQTDGPTNTARCRVACPSQTVSIPLA